MKKPNRSCYNPKQGKQQDFQDSKDRKLAEISKHEFKKICEAQIKMEVAYCFLCGKPILKIKDYNIEHLQPVSRGGRNDPSNWRMAHKTCNSQKGALTFEEYKLWLELERKRHGHQK